MTQDWMKFRGLEYDVHIGCFEPERSQKQKLKLEFDALVDSIDDKHVDDPDFIVLDYATVTKRLQVFFSEREFRLLETAAEGVAHLVLNEYRVKKIVVSLTKYPQDMPKGSSVTYTCERSL